MSYHPRGRWVRALLASAAADLFCLDASALERNAMQGVDEALTLVREGGRVKCGRGAHTGAWELFYEPMK